MFRVDPALLRIIALSLAVSFSAAAAASAVGLPLGAALAVTRFRGWYLLIVLANAMFGLPPVVVGLALYLLLSRYGPLGMLKMLFAPAAMILAQFLLALPIVVAISHRTMSSVWQIMHQCRLRVAFCRPASVPECPGLKQPFGQALRRRVHEHRFASDTGLKNSICHCSLP